MTKQGITTQVHTLLEGRGRWLRAGHDNIVNYVSMLLGNGPQTDDLLELFRDAPDWLFVEWIDGQIARIGLSAWCCQSDIETDTTPGSDQELWGMIFQLQAKVTTQDEKLARLGGDLQAAQHLLDEAGAHACQPVDGQDLAACNHDDVVAELARVKDERDSSDRQLVGVRSAHTTLRSAFERMREQRNAANGEVRALQESQRQWQRFIEDPSSNEELLTQLLQVFMMKHTTVLHARLS